MSQYASAGAHYVHDHTRIAWAALISLAAVAATFLVLALAGVFSSDDSNATLPTSSGSGGSTTVQYNGGHEEGQAGLSATVTRYDGGPEEGSAGASGGGR